MTGENRFQSWVFWFACLVSWRPVNLLGHQQQQRRPQLKNRHRTRNGCDSRRGQYPYNCDPWFFSILKFNLLKKNGVQDDGRGDYTQHTQTRRPSFWALVGIILPWKSHPALQHPAIKWFCHWWRRTHSCNPMFVALLFVTSCQRKIYRHVTSQQKAYVEQPVEIDPKENKRADEEQKSQADGDP